MGAYLSTPVLRKSLHSGETHQLRYGVACMQGWRLSMEDAHACCLDVDGACSVSLFAIFDGHGGSEARRGRVGRVGGAARRERGRGRVRNC